MRVVPNKYPALRTHPRSSFPAPDARFEEVDAIGFHEVVIDSPDHDARLASLSLDELEVVLSVYRLRVDVLAREPRVRSIALFRNDGGPAGASQSHPHTQILALPVIPARLRDQVTAATRHLHQFGMCLTCALVDAETATGHRLITCNDHFVAIAAFAGRVPYETWIIPRAHRHDFALSGRAELHSLSAILKDLLQALEALLGVFAFNLVLQTAPRDEMPSTRDAFHWRIEVLPRLVSLSGLEIGCGVYIVSLAPEEAAARCRELVATKR